MDSRKENSSIVSHRFLQQALQEDLDCGDATTDALISKKMKGEGVFLAKQNLILCGSSIVRQLFRVLDPKVQIRFKYKDGAWIQKGRVFGVASGPFHSLLKGERTALNLLQRLSGISTLTHQYKKKIVGRKTKILDTRKTLPLYRRLEKYAVQMGGGHNHRMSLHDQMMIKDNHIAAVQGDIARAVQIAHRKHASKVLVVEIQRLNQIEPAIANGATRLLLDNMTDQQIRESLKIVRKRVPVEISGQVSLSRIPKLSRMGVDYISVGAITHSAPAADISFKIHPRIKM